jgi:3-hydroxyacyl-[acyl-carrier-protein] dehydratase
MAGSILTPEQVLALVPQRAPFRFIDELVAIDETQAVGRYTYKMDESFYEGHFPGRPVTPGVILLETMCQTGVVALGIYLLGRDVPVEELGKHTTLFTDAEVEFTGLVEPGDTVTVTAEPVFWRRMKLRSKVQMTTADGKVVASGTVSGMGVQFD